MKVLIRLISALGLLSAASEAIAGTWVDDFGRVLTLQAPGLTDTVLQPAEKTVADAAALFKTICLDTNLDRSAAGVAAQSSGLGFTYQAQSMPFKVPVDVGSWIAPDAELTVARDMFFAKEPQCNLTVALPGPPGRDATVAALSALIGAPANAAKATKKDGSHNNRWQPEWTLAGPAGFERRVFVHQVQASAVQFAVIERKGAK